MATKTSGFSIKSMPGFSLIALCCIVALYVPIATLVVYAFNDAQSMSMWGGFSLRWFKSAWQNVAIQDASIRSLQIAAVAALFSTAMATFAAIATTRTENYPGLTLKYALINQPLIVPEIVTAVALLIVFAKVKVWTGYSGGAYLMAAHTAFCIPSAYLPIRALLEGMDLTLETAASDLYARPWQAFRYVTLPLLWPGVIAGALLAFVVSLDDVVITEFVKSGGQETLPTYMLGQIRKQITPEVNAAATCFLALSVLAVTVFYFISRRRK